MSCPTHPYGQIESFANIERKNNYSKFLTKKFAGCLFTSLVERHNRHQNPSMLSCLQLSQFPGTYTLAYGLCTYFTCSLDLT